MGRKSLVNQSFGYKVETFSKPHLRSNGCVAPHIAMLTYLGVRSASSARDALPLNLIWNFETASSIKNLTTSGNPYIPNGCRLVQRFCVQTFRGWITEDRCQRTDENRSKEQPFAAASDRLTDKRNQRNDGRFCRLASEPRALNP